jgi:hypothetical protein
MVKVREVEDRDILLLSEFLPKGFAHTHKEFWLSRFDMWWTKNPAWSPRIPRGWVLEDGTNLVGFIGNIPITFLVRGTPRIATASSSWFVDPSIRGIYSIHLFNEFIKQDVSLFLFKAEEEYVMNFLTRYKFEEFILPASRKEYIYILDKKKMHFIFLKFIFRKQIPKISDLPELFKRLGFLMFGYLLQKSPARKGKGASDNTYSASVCTSCDDAFLTIREQNEKPCDIMVSRDIKTLNWLYFSPSRWFRRIVIQCRRVQDSALAGYMVFDIERRSSSEPGSMQLMEMRIADNNPWVLSSLTSCAIETGKNNNAAMLVMWANSPETDTYFRGTFLLRRAARHYRYLRFSDSPEMRSIREEHGNVCPSLIYPPQ